MVEDVGKEFNILISAFSERELELVKESCPSVQEFVRNDLSLGIAKTIIFQMSLLNSKNH